MSVQKILMAVFISVQILSAATTALVILVTPWIVTNMVALVGIILYFSNNSDYTVV